MLSFGDRRQTRLPAKVREEFLARRPGASVWKARRNRAYKNSCRVRIRRQWLNAIWNKKAQPHKEAGLQCAIRILVSGHPKRCADVLAEGLAADAFFLAAQDHAEDEDGGASKGGVGYEFHTPTWGRGISRESRRVGRGGKFPSLL